MRQDMRERERQIRRLHQSIQKYEQSPKTKKAVQQATIQLVNAIEYKFRKSEANLYYSFPRTEEVSDDQFDDGMKIVDLKAQNDIISHDLSIAQEAESNHVYISEKTILIPQRFSTLSNHMNETKSKLKIKVVKKKNFQTCQTAHKLDRLKTQHINFSTTGYKKDTASFRTAYNESSWSKSKFIDPNVESTGIRKKLKLSSRIDNQSQKSPMPNMTIKTEYTDCTRRKQGKQNLRIPLETKQTSTSSQKHFISQNSVRKFETSASKPFLNVRCSMKRKKQNEINISFIQPAKKYKIAHKSTQNLKSIRLGRVSTEKMKTIKTLYA